MIKYILKGLFYHLSCKRVRVSLHLGRRAGTLSFGGGKMSKGSHCLFFCRREAHGDSGSAGSLSTFLL